MQYLPQQGNRFSRWFGRLGLRLLGGWTIQGELPDLPKAVIPVAPHTSNWDFFVGVFAMFALGMRLSFLGKHSIFVFPVNRLLRALGGIPVNRASAHGIVGEMVQEFQRREQLLLALSPEGTRKKIPEWRKGFLFIARDAKVPLIPVAFCFATKEIRISEPIYVEDDVEVTLAQVKAFTRQARGKRPEFE